MVKYLVVGFFACDELAMIKPFGIIQQGFNLRNDNVLTELIDIGMILLLNILSDEDGKVERSPLFDFIYNPNIEDNPNYRHLRKITSDALAASIKIVNAIENQTSRQLFLILSEKVRNYLSENGDEMNSGRNMRKHNTFKS